MEFTKIVPTLLLICFLSFPVVNSSFATPNESSVPPAVNCVVANTTTAASNSTDSAVAEPEPIGESEETPKNGTSANSDKGTEVPKSESLSIPPGLNATSTTNSTAPTPTSTKSTNVTNTSTASSKTVNASIVTSTSTASTPTTAKSTNVTNISTSSIATTNSSTVTNASVISTPTTANATPVTTATTTTKPPTKSAPFITPKPLSSDTNGTTNTNTTGNTEPEVAAVTLATNNTSVPVANSTREGKSLDLTKASVNSSSGNGMEKPENLTTNGNSSNKAKTAALTIPDVEKPVSKKNSTEVTSEARPNITENKNATVLTNGTTATTMPPTTDANMDANSSPETLQIKTGFLISSLLVLYMQGRY